MTQELTALAELLEAPGWVPSTHMQADAGIGYLLVTMGTRHARVAQADMQTKNSHMHKVKDPPPCNYLEKEALGGLSILHDLP